MAPSKEEKQARTALALCTQSLNAIGTLLSSLQNPDRDIYNQLLARRDALVAGYNRLENAFADLDSNPPTFSLFCEFNFKYF